MAVAIVRPPSLMAPSPPVLDYCFETPGPVAGGRLKCWGAVWRCLVSHSSSQEFISFSAAQDVSNGLIKSRTG
ncbi:hypothetical protein AOLI_G00179150 [Acnodon oligacanthus]